MAFAALQVITSLCLLKTASTDQVKVYQHIIHINPLASNAEDSGKCHTSECPCKTLNYALEYRKDSTQYFLEPNLTHELTLPVSTFRNLKTLSIMGGEGGANVTCVKTNISLAFDSVSDISFTDVAFVKCSATRSSTSRNYFTSSFMLYKFQVGLYFYLCRDVTMTRVSVRLSTNATGVVMYDTVGTNIIQDSTFTENSVFPGVPGGGGLYVEFTYCVPGDNLCDNITSNVSNVGSTYSFNNCVFLGNLASNVVGSKVGSKENSTYIVPYHSSHQAFGRGGGLSIFVKGNATGNCIVISNCRFEGNRAQWGGGLFMEFHDETINNTIHVTNCTFVNNSCEYTLTTGTGGGGMRIGHYVYDYYHDPPLGKQGNKVVVEYSSFTFNSAMYGGGLSISPTLQANGKERAIVELRWLNFSNNTGKIGAALHVGIFPLLTVGVIMNVTVLDCSFEANSAHYADLIDSMDIPHTIGIGAVYINQVPVAFQGTVVFINNSGSAIAAAGCQVSMRGAHANFTNNIGYRGGAISLLGSSYILIDSNTKLNFVGNVASDKGGAIYNKYVENDNLMTQPNCFLRHADPFLNPNKWNAVFVFSRNTDSSGERDNSIHTSSILPCARPGGDGFIVDTDNIFCWANWTYHDTFMAPIHKCNRQVTSEVGMINYRIKNISVIPGQTFRLPLNIIDDYRNDMINETVFSSTITYDESVRRREYFWGGNAVFHGKTNTSIDVILQSLGDRIWYLHFIAELLPCPPGLKPAVDVNDADIKCVCSDHYLGMLDCNPDTLKAQITDKTWMGKIDNDSSTYLLGICPPSFCQVTNSSQIPLPDTYGDLSEKVCSTHRSGILCGQCDDEFGPAVNSDVFECVNCTDINLASNIAKYVSAVYLPLAVLFTAIILFDIQLTKGPANAFILYSQVVSSTFSLDADGQIPWNRLDILSVKSYEYLLKGYKFTYGICNLEFIENFLPPICLSSRMNTLAVLLMDYGVAFFPLVMIIIVVISLKIRDCCSFPGPSRPRISVPLTTRCCLRIRSVTEALLPAFAAFLLLSYTKFNLTSSYIIESRPLIDENGNRVGPGRVYYAGHLEYNDPTYTFFYLLPSWIIFIFGCITPLLLLSYPLRLFEWCISRYGFLWRFYPRDKVHAILDSFQGCYRNKMRFFAGLYFLFRLTINTVYLATDSWLHQYITQQIACVIMATLVSICQPYNKENWLFNYVDTFIFTNLAVINALSLYFYAVFQKGQNPPFSAFVFQYVLIFLPLLYMIIYVIWYIVMRRNKCVRQYARHYHLPVETTMVYDDQDSTSVRDKSYTKTEVDLDNNDDLQENEHDEAIFARAESVNRYQRGKEVEVYDYMPPSSTEELVEEDALLVPRAQTLNPPMDAKPSRSHYSTT